MALPRSRRSAEEVAADLERLAVDDKDPSRGRTFSLVYHAGEDVDAVVRAAHDRYVWHNALNPDAFPSLRRMSADVVAATGWLLSGGAVDEGDDVRAGLAGFLTSGGTESILLAVKTAKVRGREERGIEHGNVVLATSAHAAFGKACEYFGLEERRVDVGPDYRADPDALEGACDDDTVLLVASAPQYPQGVIDPVADIAAIAESRGTSCHVDACMGGFTLPFLERAGVLDASRLPVDFRVPGVTTMSADVHKYGYAPKGISVILHRDKASRRRQTFVYDDWLGGFYGSSGILGTKPGGPIAAGWAALQYLGVEGLLEASLLAYEGRRALDHGVRAIEGLTIVGEPEVTLCAIGADPASPVAVDPFALGDALDARGWYLDRQGPPDSLHATVNALQGRDGAAIVHELLDDLRAAATALGTARADDRSTTYASLE